MKLNKLSGIFLLQFFIMIAILGCATNDNGSLLSPSLSHDTQAFIPNSTVVFGDLANPAFCVDLSTSVNSAGWGGGYGTPSTMNGLFWTASVAQQLPAGAFSIDDPTNLVFRWLFLIADDDLPMLPFQNALPEIEIIPEVGIEFRTPHIDSVCILQDDPAKLVLPFIR